MIRGALLILFFVFNLSATYAQDDPNERTRNWLTVVVDSAYVRALPARDSGPVASRFEGDRLEAVGRNADGTWFQVVAPYDDVPIGWMSIGLVSYSFEVTLLPLTDTTTGVTGPTPVLDTPVAVEITLNTRLRSFPARTGEVIQVIPNGVTLPVLARNPAGDWLQVNYNGTVGWVAVFLTDTVNDLATLPVLTPRLAGGANLPSAAVRVVPAEVQLAQINRLRQFIAEPLDASQQLSRQISSVVTGEIVPCVPVSASFDYYVYTAEDVRQLPELGRYGPSLNRSIDNLNEAIEMIGACGVYTEATFAKATSLLPTGFFNGILFTLNGLEREILSP